MKTFTLTQTTKQHDANKLHDAFNAASIPPALVQSTATESTFIFQDSVTDPSIQSVVTAYTFTAPGLPPDAIALGQAYRTAVTNATTLAQCKAVLNGELWQILKYLARDVNLGN